MKIAYLMNTYPMTSTTFIRREIDALEQLGVTIERYAIRRWSERLVDVQDVAEAKKTKYFLSGNAVGLAIAFCQAVIAEPRSVAQGIRLFYTLVSNYGGNYLKHVAYLMQATYLRKRAKQDGVQHVHVHFATNAATVALLSRIMGGPTYSFTTHGPDEFDDGSKLSFDQKIASSAFAVAISHFCKARLSLFVGREYWNKIRVIHCGLDLSEYPLSNKEPEAHFFVCVGRLCRNKGQALLPAVVARLKDEFPLLKIRLVGDGESKTEIEEAIATYKVQDHFQLLGWRSNDDVRQLISTSRALVLPTFAEGLPVVIMEALALHRPVISTYIAGIPELVDGECGWIVPAGSVDHLEFAMRAVLGASKDALRGMGAVGRQRVENEFDVQIEARKLLGCFEEATQNATNGASDMGGISKVLLAS